MNNLPNNKKTQVLSSLVEGNSIRSTERMTGVHRDTIIRLLVSSGERAKTILDERLQGLKCERIQVDEIWAYVGMKQKHNVNNSPEIGDQYTFVAIDADTKLVPHFSVGKRTGQAAQAFMEELAERVSSRFQLSTDAFAPYEGVVDRVFGASVHYGQIHKVYVEENKGEKRYSPAQITQVSIRPISGHPKVEFISTSYVERQNLTMRMQMRRFTRLTNAFSKKLDNLKAAVALHFFHYNFMRVHSSLRVTPAIEAGLVRKVLTWDYLLS